MPTTRNARKATPATTDAALTPNALATKEIRDAVATLTGDQRAEIVARVKANAGTVRERSAQVLADVTALARGIKSADFAALLVPEIGGERIGRSMLRADVVTLVKLLRDDARDGGAVTTRDVAAVLGVSVGQVSTLGKVHYDESGEEVESGSANKGGEKTDVDKLEKIHAELKKVLASEGIRSEDGQYLLRRIEREIRAALPSGTDTNNRGGKS